MTSKWQCVDLILDNPASEAEGPVIFTGTFSSAAVQVSVLRWGGTGYQCHLHMLICVAN